MSSKRYLITGAAGFIGSHLTDHLLDAGYTVTGLDDFSTLYTPEAVKRANISEALAHPRFQLIEADLRDADAVDAAIRDARPHTIAHLAALAGVRNSIKYPLRYSQVNVDATVNVFNAAAAHGVQHVVFASSSSVYGNNDKTPFSEADPVDHPISPYAATKKAGELIAHTFTHLYNIPITCLRFFTVFGPRQRPDLAISKFLQLARDNQPIPMFGDGSTSRDYTFIDDIVAGIIAACDRPLDQHPYRIYNLGGNEPVSLKQLIDTIQAVTSQPLNIQQHPMQPGDVQRTWADLSRSTHELGYQPQTDLATGITRQWQWLLEQSPSHA